MFLNKLRRIPLIYWNLAGFAGGCIVGLLIYNSACAKDVIEILSPFGGILVNMLKMIVMPIIVCTLISGAASLPLKTFGKMGLAVCGWYFFTSLFAAVFGNCIALLFNPTLSVSPEKLVDDNLHRQAVAMTERSNETGNAFLDMIYSLFTNPFEALAQGKFLPVIVFSILFGLAARAVLDAANERNDAVECRQINGQHGCRENSDKK